MITFLLFISRTSEKAFGQNSGWLFLDATDNLFAVSIEIIMVTYLMYETELDSKFEIHIKRDCCKTQY